MIKTFYWYQLHQNLGPLAISVKKIIYDLLLIILVYGVFFIAFAASIGLIMNEHQMSQSSEGNETNVMSKEDNNNCEEEDHNAFRKGFTTLILTRGGHRLMVFVEISGEAAHQKINPPRRLWISSSDFLPDLVCPTILLIFTS